MKRDVISPPMERDQLVKQSKRLSWMLRHGANEVGLAMDAAGWVAVVEVLRVTGLTHAELDEVVARNDKGRLQVDVDRIRACQGHSLAGTTVTREALEASWEPYTGAGSLWHGTTVAAAENIAREGLLPGERTHVHLAPSRDSEVGKRSNTPVVLEVSVERLCAAGREVFVSPNGVALARDVPANCVVGVHAATRRARDEVPRIRGLFGIAE
jgi:putative RNA 2'-phosphotransferase